MLKAKKQKEICSTEAKKTRRERAICNQLFGGEGMKEIHKVSFLNIIEL